MGEPARHFDFGQGEPQAPKKFRALNERDKAKVTSRLSVDEPPGLGDVDTTPEEEARLNQEMERRNKHTPEKVKTIAPTIPKRAAHEMPVVYADKAAKIGMSEAIRTRTTTAERAPASDKTEIPALPTHDSKIKEWQKTVGHSSKHQIYARHIYAGDKTNFTSDIGKGVTTAQKTPDKPSFGTKVKNFFGRLFGR